MDPDDPVNGRLVEAIELGSLDRVRRALREGATPNARKRVTLEVRFSGTTRTETSLAESALALAIRFGREQIVRELLDAGCDPNDPISFKPAEYHPDGWSKSRWDNDRWGAELVFPYALDYACFGASLPGSPKGSDVFIVNPTKVEEVSLMARADWKPSPGVISVLLEHGGKLSTSALALMVASTEDTNELGNSVGNLIGAALIRRANAVVQNPRPSSRQSGNRGTSRQSSQPAPQSPYLSPDPRNRPMVDFFASPFASEVAELRRQVREMSQRNAVLEHRNQDLEIRLSDVMQELENTVPRSLSRSASRTSGSHVRRISANALPGGEPSSNRFQATTDVSDLRRQNRELSTRVATLESINSEVETQLAEERNFNSMIRSRSVSRQSGRAPSSHSTRIASA
ncbi:hypothetical protein HDU93_002889, partial [Gonapodya sp. JEL0774]